MLDVADVELELNIVVVVCCRAKQLARLVHDVEKQHLVDVVDDKPVETEVEQPPGGEVDESVRHS